MKCVRGGRAPRGKIASAFPGTGQNSHLQIEKETGRKREGEGVNLKP